MSDLTSPEHGVLGILIGDLISKSALFIVNPIKCSKTMQGGLLVFLQWKLREWVIDIDYIIIVVILNKKSHKFCYCILEYDYNIIFDLNVFNMSFIMIFSQISNQPSLFISITIFEAAKEFYKVPLLIPIYTSIYHKKNHHSTQPKQFAFHISSEHQTADQ